MDHRTVDRPGSPSTMLPLMGSRNEQRDAYLRGQIEPGETILAVGPIRPVSDHPDATQALITDRRILFGWRLHWPPHAGEWTHDALAFEEITRWSKGRRHDHRPMLRVEHPTHRRLEWAPAHRFLWFRWGNATAEISHQETTFSFASRRDPVFRATSERLELVDPPQGEPFVEVLPGTREERLGGSRRMLIYRSHAGPLGLVHRLRRRLARLDEDLHHGQITWWIRIGSWALLAVPAWLVSPWLALPAVLLVEVTWVVALQRSWHRDGQRRPDPTWRP